MEQHSDLSAENWTYRIACHPTTYGGVEFRSRLEARWGAFFDLLNWKWEYEPIDLEGWTPDFMVTVPGLDFKAMCDYSEFLAEVKPYTERGQWKGHAVTLLNPIPEGEHPDPTLEPGWGCMALGLNPDVSRVSFHYHKYCSFVGSLKEIPDGPPAQWKAAWIQAGNATRWKP